MFAEQPHVDDGLVEPFAVHLSADGLTLLGSQQPSPDEKFADFHMTVLSEFDTAGQTSTLQKLATMSGVIRRRHCQPGQIPIPGFISGKEF